MAEAISDERLDELLGPFMCNISPDVERALLELREIRQAWDGARFDFTHDIRCRHGIRDPDKNGDCGCGFDRASRVLDSRVIPNPPRRPPGSP